MRDRIKKISLANKQFLDCCIEIVENNLANPDFNAQVLAKRSHMSYSNLYKKVRSISGMSISAFIRAIRLKKAAVLMLSTENTINEIASRSEFRISNILGKNSKAFMECLHPFILKNIDPFSTKNLAS